MPEVVNARARLFACDPAGIAGAGGDLAVKRDGQLQMHEWTTCTHVMNVRFIQACAFVNEEVGANFDTGGAQMSKATP